MMIFNAGNDVDRQDRFTRSGAIRSLRPTRLARCRRFRPSPCPIPYDGRLTTMPSADFCPITPGVAARRAGWIALGSGSSSTTFAVALIPAPVATKATLGFDGYFQPFQAGPQFDFPGHPSPHVGQISPNKNMNFQRTTAAFTLSPVPGGFRHLVLTHPKTEPSMRFLFVGSHLCAPASFGHPLAGLPLPSASGYIGPTSGHFRYSHRGLSPHQFMPMSGVHKALQPTLVPRGAELGRWAAKW